MKKAKIFAGITLLSGVALTLAACGNSESNSNESSTAVKFSSAVPKKATKNGGTVKVAIETDTPFTGIFNNELSTSETDSEVNKRLSILVPLYRHWLFGYKASSLANN